MAIVDFNAMKSDKELFDSMADRLIKDTLKKKKEYASLYNKANMLKNEINKILITIEDTCYQNNIALSKDIHEYEFPELEDILVDNKISHEIVEVLKVNIYKIKIRLEEINELRTKMIKLDLYENHLNDMEDDTLDEEYIDLDKEREKRGITLLDTVENVIDKFNYDDLKPSNSDEYYDYVFDGKLSIKQIAEEMYGSSSYWVHIYNYDDNSEKINKIALEESISLDDIIQNPSYLKNLKIKLPKQIEFYSDEFNTAVLKEVI